MDKRAMKIEMAYLQAVHERLSELSFGATECTVKIEYLDHYQESWGPLKYAKQGDSGFDLRAAINKEMVIDYPCRPIIVPAGIRVDIPDGYEIQIRTRSGLAAKHGLVVTNACGTIDSNYEGEIGVICHIVEPAMALNVSIFTITPGMRIAQAVVAKVPTVTLQTVDAIQTGSERGAGGFGSTGV
jgi:dUTP pyrophosphatase